MAGCLTLLASAQRERTGKLEENLFKESLLPTRIEHPDIFVQHPMRDNEEGEDVDLRWAIQNQRGSKEKGKTG